MICACKTSQTEMKLENNDMTVLDQHHDIDKNGRFTSKELIEEADSPSSIRM